MEIVPYNGLTLAFLGDADMSLKVRTMLVERGCQKPDRLQKESVKWVSAKAQARFLKILSDEQFFNDEEQQILLRGRNAHSGTTAKNCDVTTYRLSTAFEAVWGYLYITRKEERLEELWQAVQRIGELK